MLRICLQWPGVKIINYGKDMSETKVWDCIVVGSGATGLMAAIQLAKLKRSVLLLESQKQVGAKILMSGGTRCNVTNRIVTEKDYCSEQPIVVRNILRSFTPQKSIVFFKSCGIDLIEEKNGQCYPSTQSAKTVLDGLIKKLKEVDVTLQTNTKVTKITKRDNIYQVFTNQKRYEAKAVVLATGGLSYPNTGSDGGGYRMSKYFGHTLVDTTPALTPLKMNKNIWTSLMGISVDAVLMLRVDNKKYMEKSTSLLFTHFGVSGLGVLDISRHWIRQRKNGSVKLTARFLSNVKSLLDEHSREYPKRTIRSFLNDYFPKRFSQAILTFLKLESTIAVSRLSKDKRKCLISFLECYELPITDVVGYGKAEVTAGGIPFKEVRTKTLESKLSPGLFFCGEILDVDGRIGGFNFQWSWASGFVAAQGVDKYLNE